VGHALGELNMKKVSTLLTILSLTAISFALTATTSTAKSQRNAEDSVTASVQSSLQAQTVVGERYDATFSQVIGMTDDHADACAYNRDVCLKGCDGATSCSNQCWINYNNCMKQ
jgi:3-methyladenine DNA glycosylase Tag